MPQTPKQPVAKTRRVTRPVTWASRYMSAAQTLAALHDAATDDLVRVALGEAVGKYVSASLEHEALTLKLSGREG